MTARRWLARLGIMLAVMAAVLVAVCVRDWLEHWSPRATLNRALEMETDVAEDLSELRVCWSQFGDYYSFDVFATAIVDESNFDRLAARIRERAPGTRTGSEVVDPICRDHVACPNWWTEPPRPGARIIWIADRLGLVEMVWIGGRIWLHARGEQLQPSEWPFGLVWAFLGWGPLHC